MAWSYSKGSVDMQLLASYSGSGFTTQGLLLLEKNSGRTMELTAQDCAWQQKARGSSWRQLAQTELLSTDGANFDVKEAGKNTNNFLNMESEVMLNVQSEHGPRKVARLLVHCKPDDHMDFKISMFNKNDMEHAGGEIGATPDEKESYLSFFSSKLSVRVKTDDNFQAHGSWVTLGGSKAAETYLNSKMQPTASLLSMTCTEVAEREAETICGKHLQKDGNHPEIFADCVFDICRGAGGEEVAQSAAAFIAA